MTPVPEPSAALRAEHDRYREALERIERVCGWDDHDGNAAVEIAREALRIGPWCACRFGPVEHRALQGNCPAVEYIPYRDFRGPDA